MKNKCFCADGCLCVFVWLRMTYCDLCWWNWVNLLSMWLGNDVSVVCISEAEWIWCLCAWENGVSLVCINEVEWFYVFEFVVLWFAMEKLIEYWILFTWVWSFLFCIAEINVFCGWNAWIWWFYVKWTDELCEFCALCAWRLVLMWNILLDLCNDVKNYVSELGVLWLVSLK